jgi:hypothetical protein
MNIEAQKQVRADWRADLSAGRLPSNDELEAWRRKVASAPYREDN